MSEDYFEVLNMLKWNQVRITFEVFGTAYKLDSAEERNSAWQ